MKTDNSSVAYAYADKHFRETCKVVLGGEVGELKDYEKWLLELKEPRGTAKSSISGKELALACPDYPAGAKFISMEEASLAKAQPLSINEIKDMDSLLGAISERFAYSGNLVFGNSSFVVQSSDVSDSFYVYKSARISGCKAVACSTVFKDSNNLFGCNVGSKDEFCMRCHQCTFDNRCFEAFLTMNSSDCHYTLDCVGCHGAMFSFGQRNAINTLGNLSLPKDKYNALRAALLEQMRAELVANKRLPSLADVINAASREKAELPLGAKQAARKFERKESPAQVQKAWDDTYSIVLGKPIGSLQSRKEWLLQHNLRVRMVDSVLGSGKLPAASYENLKKLPNDRYVNIDEALPLTRLLAFSEKEAEHLTLENAGKSLARIAFFTPQLHVGTILNAYRCPITLWSSDCEEVHGCVFVKKSAYSTFPRDSDHVFGCAYAFGSSFDINCYNSFAIQRCFEVDSARSCTGCYYCHNVENVHDSIFCSNVKNLRYAVGNVEVGKEEFQRIKTMVISRVFSDLEAGKTPVGIYDFMQTQHHIATS